MVMQRRQVKADGYTLIEILVVLFIISIVTSIALLSIGRNENKHLESFANDLSQMLTLAEEQAMLQPAVLGLSLRDNQLAFYSYQPAVGDKKSSWLAVEEKSLAKRSIPDDIQVGVETGAESSSANSTGPQIFISTNGDITPFKIYVGKQGEKPRYMIKGDADGNITNKVLS